MRLCTLSKIGLQGRLFAPSSCRRCNPHSLPKGASASRLLNTQFTQVQRFRCFAVSGSSMTEATTSVDSFIEEVNVQYEKVHKTFEDQFWATKMGLKGCSSEALAASKNEYDSFLADPQRLKAVREKLALPDLTPEQRQVLTIMDKTFGCYITEDPRAAALKERLNQLEGDLQLNRNKLELGYVDPSTGELVKGSSVLLRDLMRTEDQEAVRKACFDGLRSIGPHVVADFADIVKLRNQLARLQGYEDYYDYKVSLAEGFGKTRLFEIMDGLEQQTRDLMMSARMKLAESKGEDALLPWNMGHALAGDTERRMDPYFPFEHAVDVWTRCFAALSIDYQQSTMRLDLCDRENKYSNGFCHWPQPAWRQASGQWVPSQANFTSLATPNAVGSGRTALMTLMHEGGHAAHFANIDQRSPLFSQERAPTSVAYAENQSMFLDSLMGDADWMAKYARDRKGQIIPWDLIEDHVRATQPYAVFYLRAMIVVPYFEKALYELPEDEVTPERIMALADEVEEKLQGGLCSRPLLSIPHILADESSAYYHGYVLADMSVHQTRAYFLRKYGFLTDNPNVGKELTEVYWRPGNSASFLDLVQQLTGEPLTGAAWVHKMQEPLEEVVKRKKAEYERGLAEGPAIPPGKEPNLNMRVLLVHGDEVLADSEQDGGLQGACDKFRTWVVNTYAIAA